MLVYERVDYESHLMKTIVNEDSVSSKTVQNFYFEGYIIFEFQLNFSLIKDLAYRLEC